MLSILCVVCFVADSNGNNFNETVLNFRFTAVKQGNDNYGRFFFVVDGEEVAFVDGYSTGYSQPQGSATINLQLTAGQVVQIMSAWLC